MVLPPSVTVRDLYGNCDSASSVQAGGPRFDSPCLHLGQMPFPLDGKGLFHVRTLSKAAIAFACFTVETLTPELS